MSSTASHEQGSAFLRVPAEIRLHIYSFLLPKYRIDINLCDLDDAHPPGDILPGKNKKRSPISAMVSQNLTIEAITRSNGLHLLLVSRRIAAEYMGILSGMAVRFHCPKCFDQWLRNVSYGMGVGIKWLKHVEILFDTDMEPVFWRPDLQEMTPALSSFMVREMMKQCQHTAYAYYGRLDLMDPPSEVWKYEPYRDDDPPSVATQALSHTHEADRAAVDRHPWIANGGFPYPWMRTRFQGAWRSWREMGPGFVLLRSGRHLESDEDGAMTTKWVIKGWFDV
ncbi:hypothetical protein PV04_05471 [Phialophora macrospora]|uniref:F-box domain-containing protein n=1 Tax=Phialophora macrospora TaxID=1851006 RepID=A0A0D2CWQ3_9EURO|nr:hypothetical protein PV04_05471 [Phialophora macrospora]